jgi:hypothetical protein
MRMIRKRQLRTMDYLASCGAVLCAGGINPFIVPSVSRLQSKFATEPIRQAKEQLGRREWFGCFNLSRGAVEVISSATLIG